MLTRDHLINDIAAAALPFLIPGTTLEDASDLYVSLDDARLRATAANVYAHEERENLARATCEHHITGPCPACAASYCGFLLVPDGAFVEVRAPERYAPHGPWRFTSDRTARHFIDRWLTSMER